MKKRLLVLALALGLLLTACGGGETPEGSADPEPTTTATPVAAEFTLPYYAGSSLHPISGESKTNLTLAGLVYEGLFALDNEFQAQKVLCKGYTVSPDGLTWTLNLADRAFSNGQKLTPQDVVYSLNLARESPLYASRLVDIKTVQEGERQVTIALNRPRSGLPALLDVPIVREEEGATVPLGTGRYAFAGTGKEISLTRNSWADGALPQSIPLTAVQGTGDLIYAFDTKEISLVTADLTGTDALGYSGGYEVWDYPTGAMVYLGFRTDKGFCQDVALRKAIALTLNRETVVSALYSHHGTAAALPLSPASPDYDTALAATLDYAPKQAALLLEQAGYTVSDGRLMSQKKPVRLTLLVNTDNAARLGAADYLAGELGQLGLDVAVNKLAWADYAAALQSGEFDLYLAETVLPGDFDLTALLGTGGSLNYGRWTQGETQTLLAALRAAQGGDQNTAATALYTQLTQQVPIAPICFKTNSVLTQWGQVTGLTPTRSNPFAGDEWRLIND